jgi:hypothetical protein
VHIQQELNKSVGVKCSCCGLGIAPIQTKTGTNTGKWFLKCQECNHWCRFLEPNEDPFPTEPNSPFVKISSKILGKRKAEDTGNQIQKSYKSTIVFLIFCNSGYGIQRNNGQIYKIFQRNIYT